MATSILTTRRPIDSLRHDPTAPGRHVDAFMILLTAALTVVGLFAIYSARNRALLALGSDPYFFVKRQGFALGLGVVVMVVIALVDYRKWRDWAAFFFIGTAGLLVAVKAVGTTRNGTQAWFELGTFQLQPSELAKVTLILALAGFTAAVSRLDTWSGLLRLLLIAAIPIGLTLAQPDVGTTMVLGAITGAVLIAGGTRLRHLALLFVLAVGAGAALLGTGTLEDYQEARLTAFLNPDKAATAEAKAVASHLEESQTAIGNGGVSGKGFLNGTQTKRAAVPEQHTDFVFSVIGEEAGFIGSTAVLGLFGLMALRIWRTAAIARDDLGAYICVGALAMLVFQVFENVGMTMGLMPITGIPLPLISYGGSSTLAFFAMLGLVQSVHMHRY